MATDTLPGESSSPLTRRVVAPNAGPMTLDGTNTYVIGTGHTTVVIDPGPLDDSHLAALAARPVELILLTHHHPDHTEAATEFTRRTGAPVRAIDSALCIAGDPLVDGEVLSAAGVRMRVLATPGHTSDSMCVHLPDDGDHGSVITGDTILGRGTTVIAHPDGNLGAYLTSLDRLEAIGSATVLPAHGPTLDDLAAVCRGYRAHRQSRLEQVQGALTRLGLTPSLDPTAVEAITEAAYPHVPDEIRFAAEASVRAQLAYLAAR